MSLLTSYSDAMSTYIAQHFVIVRGYISSFASFIYRILMATRRSMDYFCVACTVAINNSRSSTGHAKKVTL